MSRGAARDGLLFLCVANSARSQMAEGWARRLAPEGLAVHSAGSAPGTLSPFAVRVMSEVGIDMDSHRSKAISEVPLDAIGTIITLCAEEVCPVVPGNVERLHWPFPDPAPAPDDPNRDDETTLARFREVRDGIERRVRGLMETMSNR